MIAFDCMTPRQVKSGNGSGNRRFRTVLKCTAVLKYECLIIQPVERAETRSESRRLARFHVEPVGRGHLCCSCTSHNPVSSGNYPIGTPGFGVDCPLRPSWHDAKSRDFAARNHLTIYVRTLYESKERHNPVSLLFAGTGVALCQASSLPAVTQRGGTRGPRRSTGGGLIHRRAGSTKNNPDAQLRVSRRRPVQTCQAQKWVGCVGGSECEADPPFFILCEIT